jgi:hypothetical protein
MPDRHFLVVAVLLAAGCRQGCVVDMRNDGTRRFPAQP